jgi:hypothetical protein
VVGPNAVVPTVPRVVAHHTWLPGTSGAEASTERSQRLALRQLRLADAATTPSRVSVVLIEMRRTGLEHSIQEFGMTTL